MQLTIAIGKSRETKVWRNTKITWSALVEKLSKTIRTPESYKDYCAFPKEKQSNTKDQGGFVGGHLTEGKRSPKSVKFRQLLTFDLDLATYDFWEDYTMCYWHEAVLHSTHKHSAKTPRYRLIIPLDRTVTGEEYEAIARRVAGNLDINLFDPTTFQPERLMYWPSTSKDGVYVFRHQEGEVLNADDVLATYIDWRDMSEWPMLETEKDLVRLGGKQQGNPTEKPGLVGAFCRAYNIHQAIETFLSDVYEPTEKDDRYTYSEGESASGAIVYGEGDFLYSHHSTDPASQKLLNAYDLVRLHMFGHEDKGETELAKQKSNKLMADFAAADPNATMEIGLKRLSAQEDFEEYVDKDWLKTLTTDKYGEYENTIPNFYSIIANDPNLSGRLRYNMFSHRACAVLPLPWNKEGKGLVEFTDKDDAGLRHYLEQRYNIYHVAKSQDALSKVFHENSFHPVQDYIRSLTWDGEERINTLLIDYLGAKDTEFNQQAIRKMLVAAVARVFIPGIKYDYVLTLIGTEGIGKSTMFDRLGKEWFSDSFLGVEGTKAYEQLQGSWIIEIAELAGFKKSEVEQVKHFISKRVDKFRVAYGRRTEEFPRQCVFVASTNEKEPLKGTTGNRRFWPVPVTGYGLLQIGDLDIDQIWAEAKTYFDAGEALYFDAVAEQEAREIQHAHTEVDDRYGSIERYLETLLPEEWDTMDILERRNYLNDTREMEERGEVTRLSVCTAEVWTELFQGNLKDMGPHNTKYINQIISMVPGWEKAKSNLTFPIYGKQRAYVLSDAKITRTNKRKANRV